MQLFFRTAVVFGRGPTRQPPLSNIKIFTGSEKQSEFSGEVGRGQIDFGQMKIIIDGTLVPLNYTGN